MNIHYYRTVQDAISHNETVELVHWVDGFKTEESSEITFRRVFDGKEVTIPFENFITVTTEDDIEKAINDWHIELTNIAAKLGRAELLAGLAEEAAELSQAALKLRRVLDGRNPTPVTETEATLHLQEELTDVLLCAVTFGVDRTEIERFIRTKSARWSARVEGDVDN